MTEHIHAYNPTQAAHPAPILQSMSHPQLGGTGPTAMDRGMGTRQSVTFADMQPNLAARPATYYGPPDLLQAAAQNGNTQAQQQTHLQAHHPSATLARPTSLLSAASASSALSELSESLRWAQKFPEGKHLSRARNSVMSMINKDKSASEGGSAGAVAAATAASASDASDNIRASRSRLSALSLNGILKAPRAWRSEEENQTVTETRNGLRFLAKRREEVEGEDYNVHAAFVPHADPDPRSGSMKREKENYAGEKEEEEDEEEEYDDAWEDDMGGPRRYVGSLPSKASMPQLGGEPAPVAVLTDPSSPRKARWNTFKWVLFLSTIVVFAYGAGGLVAALLTWSRSWGHADVTVVADTDILIFITLASFLCVLTSVVGLCGAILNNRPILALYAFLLWPTFISMMVVGYSSYKRANLRLDRKLNMAWSRYYTDLDRLRLQNNLHCCGFYSPLHEATFSRTCYPRTTLPGCKGKLYRYERSSLQFIYRLVFTFIFIHLGAIAASLLCSNHVNEQFGKGLTPRAYRLDMGHVRRNAVNIMRALIENGEMPEPEGKPVFGAVEYREKAGWDAGEETPVSSAHGHEEKAAADMAHAGDIGHQQHHQQQQHGHDGMFNPNYNFPPRTADHGANIHAGQPQRPSDTADVGAGGIRVISYHGGPLADGLPHVRHPDQQHPQQEAAVRGLGFTMAVPAETASSLRDRRLGDFA